MGSVPVPSVRFRLRPVVLSAALAAGAVLPEGARPGPTGTPEPTVSAPVADSVRVTRFCVDPDHKPERWLRCDELEEDPSNTACPCDKPAFLLERPGSAPVWSRLDPRSGEPGVAAVLPNTLEARVSLCPTNGPSHTCARLVVYEGAGFPDAGVLKAQVLDCAPNPCFCWGGLPASSGSVTLAALGHRSKVVAFSVDSGEAAVIPGVALEPRPPAALRLQDDLGQPVGAAEILLTWTVDEFSENLALDVAASGSVLVPYFDEGVVDLEMRAPCCVPAVFHDLDPAQLGGLDPVRLPRLGEVVGECRPAEDPEAVLVRAHVCAVTATDPEPTACANTDDGGRFTLDALPPATYTVEIDVKGRPGVARRGIKVEPGERVELGTIEMEPGALVRILVVDGSTELPVEGASITLEHQQASETAAPSVTTNELGESEFAGLTEGRHPFTVTSTRHAPVLVELEARVEVEDPEEVRLSKGGRIEGMVLDGGRPAEGDRIVVELRTGVQTAAVDAQGHYALDYLPAGRVPVQRRGKDGKVEFRHAEVIEDETAIVNFGVGTTLSGRVSRTHGPVPGAAVALFRIVDWSVPAGRQLSVGRSDADDARPSIEVASRVTDLDGEFVCEGLEAGQYSLTAATARGLQTRIVHVMGLVEERVDIQLDTFLIRGKVLTTDGKPLAGALVASEPTVLPSPAFAHFGSLGGAAVELSSWPQARTQSGEDGTFALEIPASGTWEVSALMPGLDADSKVLEIGSNTDFLEFRLGRRSRMNVWVEGPGGAPINGGYVTEFLRNPQTQQVASRSSPLDPHGKLTLDGRPGLQSWITASHPAFAPACPRAVTYPDENEDDVVLVLERGGTLRLGLGDGGAGEFEWDVLERESSISMKDLTRPPHVVPRDGGLFLILEGLPSCPMTLVALGQHRPFQVAEGGTVDIDLTDTGEEPEP